MPRNFFRKVGSSARHAVEDDLPSVEDEVITTSVDAHNGNAGPDQNGNGIGTQTGAQPTVKRFACRCNCGEHGRSGSTVSDPPHQVCKNVDHEETFGAPLGRSPSNQITRRPLVTSVGRSTVYPSPDRLPVISATRSPAQLYLGQPAAHHISWQPSSFSIDRSFTSLSSCPPSIGIVGRSPGYQSSYNRPLVTSVGRSAGNSTSNRPAATPVTQSAYLQSQDQPHSTSIDRSIGPHSVGKSDVTSDGRSSPLTVTSVAPYAVQIDQQPQLSDEDRSSEAPNPKGCWSCRKWCRPWLGLVAVKVLDTAFHAFLLSLVLLAIYVSSVMCQKEPDEELPPYCNFTLDALGNGEWSFSGENLYLVVSIIHAAYFLVACVADLLFFFFIFRIKKYVLTVLPVHRLFLVVILLVDTTMFLLTPNMTRIVTSITVLSLTTLTFIFLIFESVLVFSQLQTIARAQWWRLDRRKCAKTWRKLRLVALLFFLVVTVLHNVILSLHYNYHVVLIPFSCFGLVYSALCLATLLNDRREESLASYLNSEAIDSDNVGGQNFEVGRDSSESVRRLSPIDSWKPRRIRFCTGHRKTSRSRLNRPAAGGPSSIHRDGQDQPVEETDGPHEEDEGREGTREEGSDTSSQTADSSNCLDESEDDSEVMLENLSIRGVLSIASMTSANYLCLAPMGLFLQNVLIYL